jgi:ribonuclease BN (tRNA processing enzyme)
VYLSHLHNDHGLDIGMLSCSNRPGGLPMGFPASSEWYGKKTPHPGGVTRSGQTGRQPASNWPQPANRGCRGDERKRL